MYSMCLICHIYIDICSSCTCLLKYDAKIWATQNKSVGLLTSFILIQVQCHGTYPADLVLFWVLVPRSTASLNSFLVLMLNFYAPRYLVSLTVFCWFFCLFVCLFFCLTTFSIVLILAVILIFTGCKSRAFTLDKINMFTMCFLHHNMLTCMICTDTRTDHWFGIQVFPNKQTVWNFRRWPYHICNQNTWNPLASQDDCST